MNRRALLAALLGAVSTAAISASRASRASGASDASAASGVLDTSSASGNSTHAHPPRRIVVLEWALTEMLLSIGVVPVGVANTAGFRRAYPTETLPSTVVDLGLMFQPNMELLLSLQPDLIVISPAHAALRASLERLAPTVAFGHYRSSPTPYKAARDETLRLAQMLDCVSHAQTLLASADRTLDDARTRLASMPGAHNTPLYIVRFLDETHLRVYGAHSLFGEMLAALGLRNAWQGATNSGAYATIPFEALEPASGTALLYQKPLPSSVVNMMKTSPLWAAMPFARAGHMIGMPGVPAEGTVPSAVYFVRTLMEALEQETTHTGLADKERSTHPEEAHDHTQEHEA
jgi:ABC-type Fe3+-hydroxamate transport system substrate-binding protein